MRTKKKKKKKKGATPEKEARQRQSEIWTYVIIVLFALLGLFIGYMMYQEFAGFELREDGHYHEIEIED